MSGRTIERLFAEFARAYQRGEGPDVAAYLEQAGDDQDDLGRMLDRFLQAVAARVPSEEEIVLMQARLEQVPPLVHLRLRRRLERGTVVDALVRALGVDPVKRDKVAGYYHDLEVGTLDPKPVSSRVWSALAEVLQANVRALAGLRPEPPPLLASAYHRLPTESARYLARWDEGVPDEDGSHPTQARSPERDEVDELFTGSD